jgi:hypothetical protein
LEKVLKLAPEIVVLHSTWAYGETDSDRGLDETVARLGVLKNTRIVLLGPVPAWKGAGLSENVLEYYLRTSAVIPERTNFGLADWPPGRDKFLEAKAKQLQIQYISPLKILCDDRGCLARIGGSGSELTAFDPGHLTVPGSLYLARAIWPELLHGPQSPYR